MNLLKKNDDMRYKNVINYVNEAESEEDMTRKSSANPCLPPLSVKMVRSHLRATLFHNGCG